MGDRESEQARPGPQRPRHLQDVVVVGVIVVLAIALAVIAVVRRGGGQQARTNQSTTRGAETQPAATTQATQAAATKPTEKRPTTQYFDVVKLTYPKLPATRPLGAPLNLNDASRLVIDHPLYLSPRQDIWVTHPDAPPAEQQIKLAEKLQNEGQVTIALRDEVVYAHWRPVDGGPWTFDLLVRKADGSLEVVTSKGREPFAGKQQGYDWSRAVEWNEEVIVPTKGGIALVRFAPEQREQTFELVKEKDGEPAATRFVFDWAGFIAWAPPEAGKKGSSGAVRFVEGKWVELKPEDGWPAHPLQLLPQTDGSVMTIDATADDGTAKVTSVSLEKLDVDEKKVLDLVEQLSDEDEKKRKDAYTKLAGYGPGAWPVLEKALPTETPEAQVKLKELLKARVAPTLGGMALVGGAGAKLQALTRYPDGGALFYAPAGVSIPSDGPTPDFRTPAWINVQSGPWVSLLEYSMTRDLESAKSRVELIAGDWVVTDANGPRMFVGNGFVKLLRKDESAFDQVVGRDGRGRWFFRRSTDAPGKGATLVIDPTLPDPTPRLPVWAYTTAEIVGWDGDDWPAVKRVGAWTLKEQAWTPLDESKSKLFSKPEEVPPPKPPRNAQSAATRPVTSPATATAPATTTVAATSPATATSPTTTTALSTAPTSAPTESAPLIMIDADGAHYYDGTSRLIVVDASGKRTVWELPAIASGNAAKVWLVQEKNGAFYLFNQPGRVLRFKRTSDGPEPFEVEATFTKRIPSNPKLTRVWLDPANRIIIAHGSQLAILFPEGYIPPPIAQMMPADQLELEGK
jgi:hypothetical protein